MKKLLLALAVLGMTAVSVEAKTNTRPRAKAAKAASTEVVKTESDSKLYKTSKTRVMWKSAHGNMWVDRHSVRKLN